MNKTENIVFYRGIGAISFVRNKRARNLSIRINPRGEVRVTVPRFAGMKVADAFVRSKERWIIHKLNEFREKSLSAPDLSEGQSLHVRGRTIPVERIKIEETLEDAAWRILLKEAKAYLPGRTEQLAELHGFRISGVKIRKMKTRWGSCSAGNGINLNSWLIMLPDHLVDYVILHELVHTRHRDHGPAFWEALDKITGGISRALRKELRERTPGLWMTGP